MATKDSCGEIRKVLQFCILWILGFLPLTLGITSNVSDHNREIRNYLKTLNKPYVKSIKSPDGDIIDCVPINLQPAFDNPLLKNHTIQMHPSSYPKGFSGNIPSSEKPISQLWLTKGRCPKETIPIRRTRKEDLLRATSLQSYGKKTSKTIPSASSSLAGKSNANPHEYASQYVEKRKFYGGTAGISVWNPRVGNPSEFSLAQIWVTAGADGVDLNSVEAGWQVYSRHYGDDRTRLFIYWTMDAYKTTGCYNMKCSGFVQISESVALGASVSTVSSYNGERYLLTVLIFKDRQSGDWWLQFDNELIGYWPASLFTHLRDSATSIDWGGEVVNTAVGGKHTETEMGSGRFSEEGYSKAADFIKLQVVDESNALITPVGIRTEVTNSRCYDLTPKRGDRRGELFYFGGPGRNPKCP